MHFAVRWRDSFHRKFALARFPAFPAFSSAFVLLFRSLMLTPMHRCVCLQYQAETKQDMGLDDKELTDDERLDQLKLSTAVGIKCEFCGNEIRPFPTLEEQKGTFVLVAGRQ